jgi:hypothetical protein
MDFTILNILSLANVLVFVSLILFTKKERNRFYLQYILLTYPLLSNYALPSINTFVLITLIYIFFFYRKSLISDRRFSFYKIITYILICSIIVGFILNGGEIDRDKFIYVSQISALLIYSKILTEELKIDYDFYKKIILCLKITVTLSFLFLLIQFIFGPEVSLSRTMNPNIVSLDAIRYPSFLSDPQVYAQFLGMIGFLCLINNDDKKKGISINHVLLVFSIFAILMTGARAGLTGLIIGFFILILFGKSKHRFALVFISAIAFIISNNLKDNLSIFKRGGDINDSYDFRFSIWLDAIEIFKNYPLFGIGVGNYTKYASIHLPDQYWVVDNEIVLFDHPESGYLKFLTEFGLIGFLCFCFLFIAPMVKGINRYFINNNISIIIFISSIICWMVGFFSTFSFGDIRIAILVITILCMLIELISVENNGRIYALMNKI